MHNGKESRKRFLFSLPVFKIDKDFLKTDDPRFVDTVYKRDKECGSFKFRW